MAALTWRNVDAPNFGTALQGYQQFSQMLNQGLDGARAALTTYDDKLTDTASNEFIQNILTRYAGSPDQLNADMQSGAVFEGVDRSRLNEAALATIRDRPQELLTYATGAQRLDDAKGDTAYEGVVRGRETDDRASLVAARPQVARLLAAASSDDPAAVAAVQNSAEYRAAMTGLDPIMQAQIAKAPLDQIQGILDLEGSRIDNAGGLLDNAGKRIGNETATFNLEKGRWEFGNAVVDRRDQQAGMAIGSAALAGSVDARSALLNLEASPEFQRASPMAQNVARGMLAEQFGNLYQSSPGQSLTDTAGSAGSNVPYDSFVIALESGGDPTARAGTSSATGLHQFTETTWLNTVRDAAPAWARGMSRGQILAQRTNPTRSAEMERALRSENIAGLQSIGAPATNENVYAMHHFGPTGGANFARAGNNVPMTQILTPAQINANPYLRNLTKGQAMQNWNRRAGGGASSNVTIDAAVRSSQIDANTGTDRWAANLNDQSSAPEVARALRGTTEEPGLMAGVPEPWLRDRIADIVRRGTRNGTQHITYAEAGRILTDTMQAQHDDGYINGPSDWLTSLSEWKNGDVNMANGYVTNNAEIDRRVAEAVRGVPQDRAQARDTVANSTAAIQQARARVASAQATIQSMMDSGRPGVARSAAFIAAQARLDAARQDLMMTEGSVGENTQPRRGTVTPEFNWLDPLPYILGR